MSARTLQVDLPRAPTVWGVLQDGAETVRSSPSEHYPKFVKEDHALAFRSIIYTTLYSNHRSQQVTRPPLRTAWGNTVDNVAATQNSLGQRRAGSAGRRRRSRGGESKTRPTIGRHYLKTFTGECARNDDHIVVNSPVRDASSLAPQVR